MERIEIVNCFDYDQLLSFLYSLRESVLEVGRGRKKNFETNISAVIIDSIAPLVQPCISKNPFGHSLMFIIRSLLIDIASTCNSAIVVTNFTLSQDWSNKDGGDMITSAMGKETRRKKLHIFT